MNTYRVVTESNGKKIADFWTVASANNAIEVTQIKRGKSIKIVEVSIFIDAQKRASLISDYANKVIA